MSDDQRAAASGAVVVAGLSLMAGDAVSAFAGIAGAAVALGAAIDIRRHRAEQVLREAAEHFEGEVDLAELAGDDPARLELLARVVNAGARAILAEKIPALAEVLAQGLQHDDQIDEAIILAAALDELEAPHMQVLALIASAREEVDADPANSWSLAEVLREKPGGRLVAPALVASLDRHGLVLETTPRTTLDQLPQRRWTLTDLGERILTLLGHEWPQARDDGN